MSGMSTDTGWTFIRITDEVTVCDVCGRPNLKSTTLFNGPDGELYAGSECARQVTGWTTKDVRAARDAQADAQRIADSRALSARIADEHGAIMAHFGVTDILDVPRSDRKAFLAARAAG